MSSRQYVIRPYVIPPKVGIHGRGCDGGTHLGDVRDDGWTPTFGGVTSWTPTFGGVTYWTPTFGGVTYWTATFGGVTSWTPTFGGVTSWTPTFGGVTSWTPTFGGVTSWAPTFGGVTLLERYSWSSFSLPVEAAHGRISYCAMPLFTYGSLSRTASSDSCTEESGTRSSNAPPLLGSSGPEASTIPFSNSECRYARCLSVTVTTSASGRRYRMMAIAYIRSPCRAFPRCSVQLIGPIRARARSMQVMRT